MKHDLWLIFGEEDFRKLQITKEDSIIGPRGSTAEERGLSYALRSDGREDTIEFKKDGRIIQGIYHLKGDDLRMSISKRPGGIPDSLEAEAAGERSYIARQVKQPPQLQGEWRVAEIRNSEDAKSASDETAMTLVFDGHSARLRRMGTQKEAVVNFGMTVFPSDMSGAIYMVAKDRILRGTYGIDGNTLHLRLSVEKTRVVEFVAERMKAPPADTTTKYGWREDT